MLYISYITIHFHIIYSCTIVNQTRLIYRTSHIAHRISHVCRDAAYPFNLSFVLFPSPFGYLIFSWFSCFLCSSIGYVFNIYLNNIPQKGVTLFCNTNKIIIHHHTTTIECTSFLSRLFQSINNKKSRALRLLMRLLMEPRSRKWVTCGPMKPGVAK